VGGAGLTLLFVSAVLDLRSLLAERSTEDGVTEAPYPGVHFYRASGPVRFRKAAVLSPRLIVAAQGRKIAKFPEGELVYDAEHYMVVTGGTSFEGQVVEASEESPYLALCLGLAPEVVARTLLALADAEPTSARDEAPPARLQAFVSPLDAPMASGVVRLLRALEDPVESRILAPLVLDEIVFRLLRSDAASFLRAAVREGDANIQEAMRYMREHTTRPLSVQEVARHVGMSESHFAHRFSAVARLSPMRYLKQLRLEAARQLMLGQRVRAGDAALQVGYESASHFTRDFKQAFGSSPGEYVRRVLGSVSAEAGKALRG
jgi:AraC-like DNA-binding protein